jgi:hypothetical protein
MKKNIGTIDMVIRLVIFSILFYIGFFNNPLINNGLPKTIIGIFSFIPLLTAVFRFCPLYVFVGMNTCACNKKDE